MPCDILGLYITGLATLCLVLDSGRAGLNCYPVYLLCQGIKLLLSKVWLTKWLKGFPGGTYPTQEMWVQSLGWEDPLEQKMELTPVFLPGKSHGQRSQVCCSQQCCRVGHSWETKQQQMTEGGIWRTLGWQVDLGKTSQWGLEGFLYRQVWMNK